MKKMNERMTASGLLFRGFVVLLGTILSGAAKAGGPAVSALNGKASVQGGVFDGYSAGIADVSVTIPLGRSFGAQADFASGLVHDRSLVGVAGQGFWRDPDRGLLGIFSSHLERVAPEQNTMIHANRIGGEAEYYRGQFTASLAAGGQSGQVKKGAFAAVTIAWYPNGNLRLRIGADIHPGPSHVVLGFENQLGAGTLSALSVFADVGISDGNGQEAGQKNGYAYTGLRYYFGPAQKSLIQRHREDDPPAFAQSGGGSGGAASGQTFNNFSSRPAPAAVSGAASPSPGPCSMIMSGRGSSTGC